MDGALVSAQVQCDLWCKGVEQNYIAVFFSSLELWYVLLDLQAAMAPCSLLTS